MNVLPEITVITEGTIIYRVILLKMKRHDEHICSRISVAINGFHATTDRIV